MIRLSVFALVVFLVGLVNVVDGQIVLPTTPNPALPLTITLTPQPGISNCVLPVRVTVSPDTPLTEIKRLQLRIRLYTAFSKAPELECRFPIDVQPGSMASQSWIYLPLVVNTQTTTVEILDDSGSVQRFVQPVLENSLIHSIDSRYINDLVVVESGSNPAERFPDLTGLIAARTNVLFDLKRETALESDDARELARHIQWQARQTPGQNIPWVNVTPISYDRLCDRWQGMTVQSPILIESSLFKRLSEENPALIRTLREWTLMSGELWIYGVESSVLVDQLFGKTRPIGVVDVSEFEDYSSLLTVDSKAIKEMVEQSLIDEQKRRTQMDVGGPDFNMLGAQLAISNSAVDEPSAFVAVVESDATSHPFFAATKKEEIQQQIRVVDYGMCRVLAINTANLFQLSRSHWQAIFQGEVLGRSQAIPKQNFSVSTQTNRLRFALTRDLGGPPVFLFWGLISVFVIGTGPILYLWLKRRHRLYRIYLWVPIVSLLLTLLTFMWTTLQEGFSVRSYISRLTFIDSAHGRVDVSTETMFNPIGPQKFSHDAKKLVVPLLVFNYREDEEQYGYTSLQHRIPPSSSSNESIYQLQARVIFEDARKEQIWSGEILAAREQQPFVTYKPTVSTDFLSCLNGVVTNRLTFDLRNVLICEANEKLWYVDSLRAGDEAIGKLLSRDVAAKQMQSIVNKMPVLIEEPFSFHRQKFMGIPYFNTVSAASNREFLSVAENKLYEWSRTVPSAGSFIGENAGTVDDPLVQSAKIVGGVHLIMGRLLP